MNDPEPKEDGGAAMGTMEEVWIQWDRLKDRESFVVVAMVIVVAVFPWVLVRAPVISDALHGYQGLASLILIWGIFAVGFDLLLGYTGLLSFGHAVFWGGASYAAGLFSFYVVGSPVLMVVVGTIAAVLLAWVIGFLSLRRGGIYFAVLTLAFGQMMYFLFLSPLGGITGGEDGFTEVRVGELFGGIRLDGRPPLILEPLLGDWLYAFVGVVTVLSVAAAYRIINSPYGLVFAAIRENETRAAFVGLNVWRYKLMAFVLSGAFAGIAGGLFTVYQAYVPLNSLYWTTSGDIVVMTVLGGTGTLFGPMIGAAVFLYVKNVVSGMSEIVLFTQIDAVVPGDATVVIPVNIGPYWHLLLGIVFVVVVWSVRGGIWELIDRLRRFIRRNTE